MLQTMYDRLVDDPSLPQMLLDDPFKKGRSHLAVPYPFRVHDDDRPAAAHAEARRFAALDAGGAEEQSFTLEQRRQQRVQRATTAVGGAEAARAHQQVSRIGLHV